MVSENDSFDEARFPVLVEEFAKGKFRCSQHAPKLVNVALKFLIRQKLWAMAQSWEIFIQTLWTTRCSIYVRLLLNEKISVVA